PPSSGRPFRRRRRPRADGRARREARTGRARRSERRTVRRGEGVPGPGRPRGPGPHAPDASGREVCGRDPAPSGGRRGRRGFRGLRGSAAWRVTYHGAFRSPSPEAVPMRSLLCAALCLSPILAQDPEPRPAEQDPGKGTWLVEFAAAQRQAAEEGKDLFLDFTGADWCVWCQRLSGEVFAKPKFQDYAKEHFVLVELAFPRDASGQADAVREQNEELQGRFGVQGYPTILLLDSAGRPYAQTGYQPGGEEAYVEHLDELRAIKTE